MDSTTSHYYTVRTFAEPGAEECWGNLLRPKFPTRASAEQWAKEAVHPKRVGIGYQITRHTVVTTSQAEEPVWNSLQQPPQ